MGTHGNCVACRQYFGFFSFGLDSQTNRCGSCEPKLGTCKRCDQYFSGGVVDSETHRCPSCERTLRLIKKINEGELPTVHPDPEWHLDSDETCYLDTKAQHEKNGNGQLVATNKRLLFLSEHGGMELSWKRVMRISIILPEQTNVGPPELAAYQRYQNARAAQMQARLADPAAKLKAIADRKSVV